MKYKNPVPHIGGKKFMLKIIFDFDEWTEVPEARDSIVEYIKQHGINTESVSDITPIEEYK